MRLLIYLLAMMTGFSAAEAARPVSATPAAVAQGAIVVASVVSAQQEATPAALQKVPVLPVVAALTERATLSVAETSPVSRHDLIRE